MNIEELKRAYKAPHIEAFLCSTPLNLLVSVSMETGIEDWEEGDDL